MTDEKSHTEAAGAHGASQSADTRKNETCAPIGQEKRSGGHLDPIEATRAAAGQFGHPADTRQLRTSNEPAASALSRIPNATGQGQDSGELAGLAMGGLIEREEAVHALKIDVQPMTDLLSGDKTGEVRRDDRGFSVGDTVNLTCADGRTATRRITHIQRGYGLPDGLCVLSYADAATMSDHSGDANKKVVDLIERMERIVRSEYAHRDVLIHNCDLGQITFGDVRDLCDAARAIPAAQRAPRVKPLVWGDDGVAEALGLRYILSDPSYSYTGGWEVLEETTNTPMPDTDGSAEDAKAAAQADYERRILSALEPAAQDGAEVAMAECQAFSAGYEAGEKATAGGEELAKLRTEVERLRDLVGKNTDASLRVAERKDAEIARLREALALADEYLTILQTPQSEPLASLNYPMRKADRNRQVAAVRNDAREVWAIVGNVLHHGMTVHDAKARAALRAEQKGDA